MIGIVNYEVDIRGVEYKLREVDRSKTRRKHDVRACAQTSEDGKHGAVEV